jgi:hypothetical protein
MVRNFRQKNVLPNLPTRRCLKKTGLRLSNKINTETKGINQDKTVIIRNEETTISNSLLEINKESCVYVLFDLFKKKELVFLFLKFRF